MMALVLSILSLQLLVDFSLWHGQSALSLACNIDPCTGSLEEIAVEHKNSSYLAAQLDR